MLKRIIALLSVFSVYGGTTTVVRRSSRRRATSTSHQHCVLHAPNTQEGHDQQDLAKFGQDVTYSVGIEQNYQGLLSGEQWETHHHN